MKHAALSFSGVQSLAELFAQCGDDRFAQVTFDLVLDERSGYRQQGETLGDDQGLHQFEPGTLLGSQGSIAGFTVELCNDCVPNSDKRGIRVRSQRATPPSGRPTVGQ